MGQRHITLSIDEQVIKEAQTKRINISRAAELGVMKKINIKEIDEHAEHDESLAYDDPEHYWIDLNTGKCKKRGNPQFFEHKDGLTYQISEMQFRLKHNMMGHGRQQAPSKDKEVIKDEIRARRAAD